MVNTQIRLIMFFAAKNGEAVYSQQKQDLQVTVALLLLHELFIAKSIKRNKFTKQNAKLNWNPQNIDDRN